MLNPSNSDVYLDANATTRVLPQAAQEAYEAMAELFGNPSSSHITGLRARHILETARNLARQVLGAPTGRIIFTSGATEAVQMAVFSTLCQVREARKKTPAPTPGLSPAKRWLLYGATEHKAVPQALEHWNRLLCLGAEVVSIPVDQKGQLDLLFLAKHASQADMLCTMAVNNETGVIHDLAAIERAFRSGNPTAAWLVDCVQAVAKVHLNLAATSIDFAAISGHKIHAPKGIGLLYARQGAVLTPLFAGGGQESGARSGTENLPGVAALAAVLRPLAGDQAEPLFGDHCLLSSFRDRLVASLQRAFPAIVFNTPFEQSVPTTINFSVKGISGKELLDLFDAAGVRVSSGSACGSAIQGSYVLDAMGLPAWRSEGAIRLSFGLTTCDEEIRAACERIEAAGQAMRESCLIVSSDASANRRSLSGLIQLKKGSMCSWILVDAASNQCVVIDPFADLAERIESLIRCQQCRVVAILDTHQHVDHDSCRVQLLASLAELCDDSASDADFLGWPTEANETVVLADGQSAPSFCLGADHVAKTPLPGHTADSQAFLVGAVDEDRRLAGEAVRFAFTGDTLQIGGIGRTDFHSSAAVELLQSLRRLPNILGESTVVCPTHDYTTGLVTTLAAELRGNPLLKKSLDPAVRLSLSEFLADKARLDAKIDDQSNCELVCGFIQAHAGKDTSIDIRPEELSEFFQQHRHALVLDVREPQEYQFVQDWATFGLAEPPENIPLSRFANFLHELLGDHDHHGQREMIFLCRSGNRSGKAAEILRRLGFANAWHIAGGLALGTHRRDELSVDADDMEFVI